MVANPTPVPSNVPRPQPIPSRGSPPSALPLPSNNSGGVRIKTEPGSYETSGIPQSNVLNYSNTIAPQRAAQNLQEKFGAGANLQINQLHAQAGLGNPGQQPHRNPQNIQLPQQLQQPSEQQRREYAERHRLQAQAQYESLRQTQQQRSNVGNAQTDGADDWNAMVAQRRADALENPSSTYDADLTMRQRLEQTTHSMEGGGVMMPLFERPKQPLPKKRKALQPNSLSPSHHSRALAQASHPPKIPQYDGLDDDDDDDKSGIKEDPELEDDEDAINSDLDDPDDDNIEEEEGEDGKEGQIMLCTYDKVQRVKNKWKCTLKDGVLTTGGRE